MAAARISGAGLEDTEGDRGESGQGRGGDWGPSSGSPGFSWSPVSDGRRERERERSGGGGGGGVGGPPSTASSSGRPGGMSKEDKERKLGHRRVDEAGQVSYKKVRP